MFPGVSNSLSVAIRRFIPPPEHRPRHEIEAEVREEIEFHLAMTAERIEQEDRLDPQQSRIEALKRFGDPDTITKKCTDIALKERIMLQRINTVLIALVAVGLIVVGIGTWQQQAQTTAAFDQINEKLTGLADSRDSDATTGPEQPPQNQPQILPDRVFVYANPQRGGTMVEITSDLTLAIAVEKALADISPVPSADLLVTVIRNRGRGNERTLVSRAPVSTAIEFLMGDEIFVVGSTAPLPWDVYELPSIDRAAIEAVTTTRFEADSSDPNDVSLQHIFETAASKLELRLVMNAADIEDYEYTLDLTIPKPFLESLNIRQALDYACVNVRSIDFEQVFWDIHEGTLIVGSIPFIASRATVTATYRIDDLLGPFPSRNDYQDLREILTTAAGFDYWRDNGGDVSLYTEVEGRLSITTIPRYQRMITSVLESLRDQQQQYPRSSLQDANWLETRRDLSNAAIASGLSPETTVIEAIQQAFQSADLPGHIAFEDLDTIGFDGQRPIGRVPNPADSISRLLEEWTSLASPDDFDRADWAIYGNGIIVRSQLSINSMGSVAIYDLASLKTQVDQDFKDSIIDLIQSRVDYNGWRDRGGDTGIIQEFQDLLAIRTSDANHREIVELLDEYRTANAP